MRRMRFDDFAFEEDGSILVSAPIVTSENLSTPVTARWCVVKPGTSSQRHMHFEAEVFFILSGCGVAENQDSTLEVTRGDALLFPPFSEHSIRNSENSVEDLVFLTIYWPSHADDEDAAVKGKGVVQGKQVLVIATPPTPNGDLHLGHLSGPYLAADIWTRYLRANGANAQFLTGTDDHQSFVEHKAHQLHQSAGDTARGYGGRIRQALTAAGVEVDHFVQPADSQPHREHTAKLFALLYEKGKLHRQVAPSLYCSGCDRYLFEVYVRGTCPHCRHRTGGNGCEECGQPNECVDLLNPSCNLCGQTPEFQPLERLVFPLEPYHEQLRDFVDRACMSTHLRTLCERMLADPLPTVSVSHVSKWGIPVPIPGFEGQVIWSWLEMAGLYLAGAWDIGQKSGWELSGDAFLNTPDLEVVQFFGFDNGYFKALLLTALYLAIDKRGHLPSTFVTNEFYRLDSKKFSTSSNHLVSVLDFMRSADRDRARFYLCYTRPEQEQTNFTEEDFAATVQRELIDGWEGWLRALGKKIQTRFNGVAPDTGLWTQEQRHFENRLRDYCTRVEHFLSAEHFSPSRVVRLLSELVRDARGFGIAESHWANVRTGRDMERTGAALELAAARALAIASSPIMPEFARQLWDRLGCTPSLEEHGWKKLVWYVSAGASVDLDQTFFSKGSLWNPGRSA